MMDVLRPGHAHRSSSDRLLSNYLLVTFINTIMGRAVVAVRSSRQSAGGADHLAAEYEVIASKTAGERGRADGRQVLGRSSGLGRESDIQEERDVRR